MKSEKIPFRVVEATGWEEGYPARDLELHSPWVKGWRAPRWEMWLRRTSDLGVSFTVAAGVVTCATETALSFVAGTACSRRRWSFPYPGC